MKEKLRIKLIDLVNVPVLKDLSIFLIGKDILNNPNIINKI